VLGAANHKIDAQGLYVLPGGVDPHAHTALKSGRTITLDDFFGSTRAAAFGGTTTIVDFAIPDSSAKQSPRAALEERLREIDGRAAIDVALHACVTRANSASMAELPMLLRGGLPTLKMFTIYRGAFMLELREVYVCLEEVAAAGGMALIHCESPHIVEPLVERFAEQGLTQVEYHARSRPRSAEADMVRAIIELLRITGAMGYVVHVSTPEAALAIANARANGVGLQRTTVRATATRTHSLRHRLIWQLLLGSRRRSSRLHRSPGFAGRALLIASTRRPASGNRQSLSTLLVPGSVRWQEWPTSRSTFPP
jgi:dihydropyrimidinase